MLKTSKLIKNLIFSPLKLNIKHYSCPASFEQILRNQFVTQCSKLDNGLTVITDEREICNACVGLFVDGGSRYEAEFENGVTHFFEHIAFKGTKSRTKTILENQMTCIGAQFKCFTEREIVGYYVECLAKDVNICTDILTDCVFNNSLSESDIEHQKKIVYNEMKDHDIDPNAMLDDFLHQTAFQGTSLGQSVMGRSSNLHGFNANMMTNYINKYFNASRTVLVGVGGVKHEQMVCLAKAYLSKLEPSRCFDKNVYRYTGSEIRYRNDAMPTAFVIVALEAPAFTDADSMVMQVAGEVVGAWDCTMPGGLEKHCNAYKSIYYTYRDTGLWGIKFAGTALQLEYIWGVIKDQWMNLCTTCTHGEVERAKNFLKTKILSRNESTSKTCIDLGRWALYFGYRPQLCELISAVDHVSVDDVRRVCTNVIYDRDPSVASIGPTEALHDYVRMKSALYWLRL